MKALVIILRGLPAGAIGPYGNRWVETPTLDALATRGVVYDWHFAVHPEPDRARRAWGAGRYAFARGNGAETNLIDALGAAGARVVEAASLDEALQALDELADEERWLVWVELDDLLPPWSIGEEVLDAYFAPPPPEEEAEDEEEEEEEEQRAAEYLEEEEVAIEPLLAPEEGPIDPADDVLYRRLQTTFAAAVTQLDLLLEELLASVGDEVLIVVTSDHGQALGEHGVVGPVRPWLHEEIVHIPLILAGPGCPAGRRIDALTASVDLAPTLAAHFGVTLEGHQGHDIHPRVPGAEVRREYVCLGLGDEWAIRTPEWYLRLPIQGEEGAERRLYVKPDDRCEVNDVSQPHFAQADELEAALRAFVEATRAPGPLVVPPLGGAREGERGP